MKKTVITDCHVLYTANFPTHLADEKNHSSDGDGRLHITAVTSEMKHTAF